MKEILFLPWFVLVGLSCGVVVKALNCNLKVVVSTSEVPLLGNSLRQVVRTFASVIKQ